MSVKYYLLPRAASVLAASLLFYSADAQALRPSASEPTRVLVRAVAHDAKIIGSSVGGARIVIQDVVTGEILAQGIQEGGTGSTTRIMAEPLQRDSVRFDTEGAAGFIAELNLEHPTLVDIAAFGPLGTPGTTMRSSKRMFLVPGEHVLGEGVILELNGFTVEIVEATGAMGKVTVGARVTMLCGCPTEPGGMWDSNDIDITAYLTSAGRQVRDKKMTYAGRTSTYSVVFDNVPSGVYDLSVVASDPARGNFGMASGVAIAP